MEEDPVEEVVPPGTEEVATDVTIRPHVSRGRIVAGIAALGGVAIALGAVLPWATATIRGTGERSGQKIVVNAPGDWPSFGLIVVGIGLGTLVVWASRTFQRPSSTRRGVVAASLCVAAGMAAFMIFRSLDLFEMVPSTFRAASLEGPLHVDRAGPDCEVRVFADPCIDVEAAPGLGMITIGGLTAVLFGAIAFLRSIPSPKDADTAMNARLALVIGLATLLSPFVTVGLFVSSAIWIFVTGVVVGTLGLWFGRRALRAPKGTAGRGVAVAGIVLAILGILFCGFAAAITYSLHYEGFI